MLFFILAIGECALWFHHGAIVSKFFDERTILLRPQMIETINNWLFNETTKRWEMKRCPKMIDRWLNWIRLNLSWFVNRLRLFQLWFIESSIFFSLSIGNVTKHSDPRRIWVSKSVTEKGSRNCPGMKMFNLLLISRIDWKNWIKLETTGKATN